MRIELNALEIKALTSCYEVGSEGLDDSTVVVLDAVLRDAEVIGDRIVVTAPEELARDFKGAFVVGWEGLPPNEDEELARAAGSVARHLGLQPSFTSVRRAMGRLRQRIVAPLR